MAKPLENPGKKPLIPPGWLIVAGHDWLKGNPPFLSDDQDPSCFCVGISNDGSAPATTCYSGWVSCC